MRATAEIKKVIESRLKNYVSRDKTGIRREMLKLFLKIRSITIPRMFEYLNRKFSISYHSVAAMVGIVASRLGILHVNRTKEGTTSVYVTKGTIFRPCYTDHRTGIRTTVKGARYHHSFYPGCPILGDRFLCTPIFIMRRHMTRYRYQKKCLHISISANVISASAHPAGARYSCQFQ